MGPSKKHCKVLKSFIEPCKHTSKVALLRAASVLPSATAEVAGGLPAKDVRDHAGRTWHIYWLAQWRTPYYHVDMRMRDAHRAGLMECMVQHTDISQLMRPDLGPYGHRSTAYQAKLLCACGFLMFLHACGIQNPDAFA